MNLYEAIYIRKSIWQYRMEPMDRKILDNLMNYADHLEMLEEHHKVMYRIIDNLVPETLSDESFIVKAPYYFVLYSLETEDYLLNAGYLLQQVALYLTTKGVATCLLEMQKVNLEEQNGYKPVLVLAFGKTNKSIHRDSQKIRRFKTEDICNYKTPVGEHIKIMIQAARYAPSVMNCQPWRFVVFNNRIHVFCKKESLLMKHYKRMKQVDMGIMLANLLVAAEELWLDTKIFKSDTIARKNFKRNEYVLTLRVSC